MDTELTEQLLYAVAVEAVGASTLPRGECGVLVTMWDQRHGACVVGPGPALETAALPADPAPTAGRKWSGGSSLTFPPDRLWLGAGSACLLWPVSLPPLLSHHLSFSDTPTLHWLCP